MRFCGEFQTVRRKQACFLTTHIYIYTQSHTYTDGHKRIPGWNKPRDFTIMLRDHGYMTRDINDETRRLSAVYR